MTQETLREAVARAIGAANLNCDPAGIDPDEWQNEADAAIATMFERLRTPSEAFVAIEHNWQDYEGGGDEVLGVFLNEVAALDCLRSRWREHGKRIEHFKPNKQGEYRVSGSPSSVLLRVDRMPMLTAFQQENSDGR